MKKKSSNFFLSCKEFIFEILKECKIKTIFLFCFSLIVFISGIIVAFKTKNSFIINDNYGVINISTGSLTSSFFTRFCSVLLLFSLLFAVSFLKWLYPLALVFVGYRAYLLGLNICLMIIKYGFSGALISLLIVLPCQLMILILLMLFYLTISKTNCDLLDFGGCKFPKQRTTILISFIILLVLILLIESILLLIFNAKIILVI